MGLAKFLCNHEACIECMKTFLEVSFVDGNYSTFKCFDITCIKNPVINEDIVKELLGQQK